MEVPRALHRIERLVEANLDATHAAHEDVRHIQYDMSRLESQVRRIASHTTPLRLALVLLFAFLLWLLTLWFIV